MYSSLRQIKDFAKTTGKGVGSFREMLGLYYWAYHPIDEENLQERLRLREAIWKGMSGRKQRVLTHTVLELCREYGRTSFLEGVKVGAQMMKEVLEAEEMEKRTR